MNKYIIIQTLINHRPETKVILFDNWFWHDNILGTYRIYSSGFFKVIPDKFADNGFRVVTFGESVSVESDCKPGDEDLIKEMLLNE